jgi:hypothetical protein
MSIPVVAIWRDGSRRVLAAPAVIAGVWAATLASAVPAALALRGAIDAHLGASLAGGGAARAVNYDWWQEFVSQADGIGRTFTPSILGFAAPLRNLSDMADGAPMPSALAATVGVYLLLQIFMTGGIVDRLARGAGGGPVGFFAACGASFSPLLRLAAVAVCLYSIIFGYIHGWLLSAVYSRLILNVTVERRAFAIRLVLTAVFLLILVAVNLTLDFAKIRLVIEDRRSALGAVAAAARFVGRHPKAAIGLYALNAVVFVAILAVYAAIAPGASVSGWTLAGAFVVLQLFILARVWARLVFVASETSLFQSRLAHARYVARPGARRPVPAAVEL